MRLDAESVSHFSATIGLYAGRRYLASGMLVGMLSISTVAQAAPCDSVSHKSAKGPETALSRSVAGQMHFSKVDLLESFSEGSWQILYVAPHAADEAFLFHSGDPEKSHYVTLWGGGAGPSEEASIRTWATTNAPGIPDGLATCFAWYVTQARR